MKILIVEDEPKTGNYLKQALVEAGFVVDLVRNGPDGLHHGLTEAYDLAVLYVMLPGIDRWAILAGLRPGTRSNAPARLARWQTRRSDCQRICPARIAAESPGRSACAFLDRIHVWDMNFDSDTNVIELAMRRLRAKVDDEFEPKLIRTVRGMGYVLENLNCA